MTGIPGQLPVGGHSPKSRYQQMLNAGLLSADESQGQVVDQLQNLYEILIKPKPVEVKKHWFTFFDRSPTENQAGHQGLYLWGGIGRGKSLLMDIFYQSIPGKRKKRVHFHDFMLESQAALRMLREQANPLKKIASDLIKEVDLLCFDEVHVDDVADAMILGELFQELLAGGVYLVATSNIAPADLYRNGLQRSRFLPAIRALEERLKVHEIGAGSDYRYRSLQALQRYISPLGNASAERVDQLFEKLAPGADRATSLEIGGRNFSAEGLGVDVAWFTFKELCGKARAASDYLFLAEHFHTLLLTDVPRIEEQDEDLAQRLIILVDVLYDQRVNLIISAAVSPEQLYAGERLKFPFQRTLSRLTEMHSDEFLARQPHGSL